MANTLTLESVASEKRLKNLGHTPETISLLRDFLKTRLSGIMSTAQVDPLIFTLSKYKDVPEVLGLVRASVKNPGITLSQLVTNIHTLMRPKPQPAPIPAPEPVRVPASSAPKPEPLPAGPRAAAEEPAKPAVGLSGPPAFSDLASVLSNLGSESADRPVPTVVDFPEGPSRKRNRRGAGRKKKLSIHSVAVQPLDPVSRERAVIKQSKRTVHVSRKAHRVLSLLSLNAELDIAVIASRIIEQYGATHDKPPETSLTE